MYSPRIRKKWVKFEKKGFGFRKKNLAPIPIPNFGVHGCDQKKGRNSCCHESLGQWDYFYGINIEIGSFLNSLLIMSLLSCHVFNLSLNRNDEENLKMLLLDLVFIGQKSWLLVGFLGDLKTPKFHSEINWPLLQIWLYYTYLTRICT